MKFLPAGSNRRWPPSIHRSGHRSEERRLILFGNPPKGENTLPCRPGETAWVKRRASTSGRAKKIANAGSPLPVKRERGSKMRYLAEASLGLALSCPPRGIRIWACARIPLDTLLDKPERRFHLDAWCASEASASSVEMKAAPPFPGQPTPPTQVCHRCMPTPFSPRSRARGVLPGPLSTRAPVVPPNFAQVEVPQTWRRHRVLVASSCLLLWLFARDAPARGSVAFRHSFHTTFADK